MRKTVSISRVLLIPILVGIRVRVRSSRPLLLCDRVVQLERSPKSNTQRAAMGGMAIAESAKCIDVTYEVTAHRKAR